MGNAIAVGKDEIYVESKLELKEPLQEIKKLKTDFKKAKEMIEKYTQQIA